MKIRLMMHDDWEVYGDGSGSPEKLMFDPAKKILDICDKHGARYTFFAEVGQQLAMLECRDVVQRNFAQAWERLLLDAVKRGHDVQLHLHPQWIGARYEQGQWKLDFSQWSIGRLEADVLERSLRRATTYLRDLLSTVRSDYRVVAFRAGSWMAQPSTHLLKVLRDLKISCDVTVVKGLHLVNDELGGIDFRSAPSAVSPWFPAADDVAKAVAPFSELFCIPTYSEVSHLPALFHEALNVPTSIPYVIQRTLKARQEKYVPLYARTSTPLPSSHLSRLQRFFQRRVLTCDFGRLHFKTMIQMLDRAEQLALDENLPELPFIMYTHSKSFYSFDNLDKLLMLLSRRADLTFECTQTVVEELGRQYHSVS